MATLQRERNSAIIRLRKRGKRPFGIAAQFNVSPGRAPQIVASGETLEQRRVHLEKRYGVRPKINELADRTPVYRAHPRPYLLGPRRASVIVARLLGRG
jgi:hypothetical protein